MAIRERKYRAMPRVDWFRVLVDLDRAGCPMKRVCFLLELPPTTVSGWKNDHKEPRHGDGERLIRLWSEWLQRHRDDVPITHMPPWLS